MKKVNWGILYTKYSQNSYDPIEIEVSNLMEDTDFEITRSQCIYEYVFDHDEKHLNLRAFDKATKRKVWQKQKKKCFICGKEKALEEMHRNHWIPWSKGGKTVIENCKMLCAECNLKKSAQEM